MSELGICGQCGQKEWRLLYHGDTTTGGTWMYRCDYCKQMAIHIEYTDGQIDDFGKPMIVVSKEETKNV